MSASALPRNMDLVFSISPAKKQARKPDKDEEIYMLILAPFNKAPKINLGQVKLNDSIEKSLLIVNPQDFTVKLNIKNTDLNINNLEIEIERQANVDFKIRWQPTKVDIYKFSIIFEVLNSRLKFIVHAFGTCFEPPKKKVYKNLTILQPIRPVVKSQPLKPVPVIEATLKKVPPPALKIDKTINNKENQPDHKSKTTKTITKSVTKTEQCIETTYIIENTVEHFEKILEHVKEETYDTQKTGFDFQRRQTEVLKTPKFNSHFNFDDSCDSGSYGKLDSAYSATVANLNDPSLLKTPIFREPSKVLRRSISATNLNTLNDIDEAHEYRHHDDFEINMTPKIKLEFDELELKRRSNDEKKIKFENKVYEIKRKFAAKKIQHAFMNYKKRQIEKRLAYEKEIQMKIREIRVKYAAVKIYKFYKNHKKRLFEKQIQQFRESKAARKIQRYWRLYAERKHKIQAANVIKHAWRLYKFRKSMSYYRNAAIKIQKWTRSMKERYNYLRFKRALIYVQQNFKRRYRIRMLAALKIQRFYHSYKYRMFEHDRMLRLNYAATVIQSLWRGYKTRKEINLIQLRNIRERLSIYVQRPQLTAHLTLGNRIKRSLNVLEQKSPSIQQIITALMDLQVVTRLSKECCIQFAEAGAISILYEFITRCNRSTPHMDLIKLCLEILINLAKCEHTCEFIVVFEQQQQQQQQQQQAQQIEGSNESMTSNALNILVGLLQAYQTSNPQIFMYVCVLFIILASNDKLILLKEAVLQQYYLKKLLQLYAALERRSNFRMKNQRLSVMPPNNVNVQEFMNETLNSTAISNVTTSTAISTSTVNSNASTVSNFNQANLLFSIEPDWSLSKKFFIQLSEPMGALQYLLVSTLKIKVESSVESSIPGPYRTPKKTISVASSLSSSTKKPQYNSIETLQQPGSAKKPTASCLSTTKPAVSSCHAGGNTKDKKELNRNDRPKSVSTLKSINADIKTTSTKTTGVATSTVQAENPKSITKNAKVISKLDMNKGKASSSASMDSLKENDDKNTKSVSTNNKVASTTISSKKPGSTIRKKLI